MGAAFFAFLAGWSYSSIQLEPEITKLADGWEEALTGCERANAKLYESQQLVARYDKAYHQTVDAYYKSRQNEAMVTAGAKAALEEISKLREHVEFQGAALQERDAFIAAFEIRTTDGD